MLVTMLWEWPDSHLSWLFSNRILYNGLRDRVLLTAASAERWPAIRDILANIQASTSSQSL